MRPTSYECSRCGMAVPVQAGRCPSCRAKVREQELVVDGPVRTGPVAAEAWATVRKDDAWRDPEATPAVGDVRNARPVGPGAVAAYLALRLVVLAGLAVVGVELARAALALAVGSDDEELTDLGWWDVLGDIGVIAVLLTGATIVAAGVLIARWASAAGHNVRALALDSRRWFRSGERVATRLLLAAGFVAAWWVAPSGPERVDRAVDLGLGVCAAAAVVALAVAAQRLLVAVTTTELERAELLTRIESAAALRPRHR